MVIVLKIVLMLLILAAGFTNYFLFVDFKNSRIREQYDSLNLWAKLVMHTIFFLSSAALISFITFLFYIIFSTITIG